MTAHSTKEVEASSCSRQQCNGTYALQQWCGKWGFKISTEKTVAVLFSQAAQRSDIKLHINGRPIKTEKSARFL